MGIKFTNNASANITHALTEDATSVTVSYGKGELFPSLASGDYFYATLAGNNGLEIVKVTARVLDTMTIVRAQDNTDPLTFEAGDLFELRVVAKSFEEFRDSIEDIQETAVHKTGNETIDGTKTFSTGPRILSTNPIFYTDFSTFSLGTAPSSTVFGGIRVTDKNRKYIGQVRTRVQTSGTVDTALVSYSLDGSKNAQIAVYYPPSGSPYGIAPSTPSGASGNEIVTADSIASLTSDMVHKTGDEKITGKKTFTSIAIEGSASPELKIINTDIHAGINPDSTEYHVVRFEDADGTSLGVLAHQSYTSGGARSYLTCTSRVGGTSGTLDIRAPADGTDPYALAPSTPEDSINNEIVTADWLAAHGGLASYAKDAGEADANTILSPGIYWLKSTSTNIPSGTNGLLQVFVLKGLILRQVFWRQGTVSSNDHNIWTRQIKLYTSGGIEEIGEWVRIITDKDSLTVRPGFIMSFAGSSVPYGYLLCNGSAVSRTTYADLFAAIGTTYGAGNGSTTFNLPNLIDKFIQYSNTAGTVKAAGLPDHKHYLTHTQTYYYTVEGSDTFFTTAYNTQYGELLDEGRGNIGNASESNAIYGKSTTVQPPALTMRPYIKF